MVTLIRNLAPLNLIQSGVTLTSIQSITLTASIPVTTSDQSNASTGSSGLSTGAKIGIGAGVGGGGAALLLAGLAFWWWRRRKQRVGDDFKWPDLGDGTGSGATAAGLFPNATHPTGSNRFEMDDEELFDGEGTTAAGHGSTANGSKMMSERDPSFLSSAAGSAGGGAGYGGGYPGAAGAGAAGMAGLGAAGAVAAHQAHRSQGGNSGGYDGNEYYGSSQDGHHQSPPGSQFSHGGGAAGNNQAYGGTAQQPYGGAGYGGYDPNAGYYGTGAPAAAAGLGAASAGLGRTGSIASTAARNYQVEAIPGGHDGMYGDNESHMGQDDNGYNGNQYSQYQGTGNEDYYQNQQGQQQGFQDRPRNRNRLSVVNNLGDVGEED